MRSLRASALISLLFLLTPSFFHGQDATGRVIGNVLDQQGAVVGGAKVTVTNRGTQIRRNTVTGKDGYFQVLDLPIGTYYVTIEHEGFNRSVTQDQKLLINQSLRFDITLAVGAANQTVTVEAQVSGVETENSTLGGSVTSRELVNLPLNGRDVLTLALLQPGVTEADPDYSGANSGTSYGGFSIAGNRPDSVTYLLDGGLNNDLLDNSVVLNPNPDTVAEFRILTSNYSAEYGRNAGGVISVVTKSGTNEWHGSAFEFVRNGAFNANSFFNNLNGITRDNLKRNQFGGTIGGPIEIPHFVHGKDRFFFFVGYQGQRLTQTQNPSTAFSGTPSTTTTFTPAEIGGVFSNALILPDGTTAPDPGVVAFLQANPYFQSDPALQAQAMIDPTKINSVSKEYLPFIPTAASGTFTPTSNHQDNNNELTAKLDFALTQKDKLSATFGGQRSQQLDPFNFATVSGFSDLTKDHNYFTNIAYTRTFSPNLLNELRFTAQRHFRDQHQPAATLPNASQLQIGITPDKPTGPPNVLFDNGLALGFDELGPTTLANNTFSISDTVSWVKGRNTWKFGAGFSDYQNNTQYDFIGNGEFDFNGPGGSGTGTNSLADFLLGIPSAYFQGPNAASNIRNKATYAFAQDEWRVRHNLTLTLGIRYEYYGPKLDTQGRSFSIIPGQQSTVFTNAPVGLVFPGDRGAPRGANFPDKDNFAPRVGFAWDPWNNGKTSLRGGFGVFYDVLKGEDNLQFNGATPFYGDVGLFFNSVGPMQNSPVLYWTDPFGSVVPAATNPFPSKPPTPNLDFVNAGFVPFNSSGTLYFVDPHLHTPYTYQYNLSLQRELAKNLIAEVDYVGSSSKGLTALKDVNPFVLGTFNRVLNLTPQPNGNISNFCAGAATDCPFATAPEFQNVGFASFNSLEASLQKQLSDNRMLGTTYVTLGYTYGHSIDTASGFRNRNSYVPAYNIQHFRASADSDITHRVTFSGGWDIAFDRAWSSGPKRLTKGWSLYPILSWRTGFPLDIPARLGNQFDPTLPGPSAAGDPYLLNALFAPGISKIAILNPKAPGNLYFNPAAFTNAQNLESTPCASADPTMFPSNACAVANPAVRTYGLPRNFFRGPSRTNFDLALAKTTQVFERLNAEFRVEAFNIFNHTEFQNPDTNINSGTFGQITGTYDPRIVQLALRLSF